MNSSGLRVALFASVAMLAAVLAACSSETPTSTPASAPSATPVTQVNEPTAAPSETSVSPATTTTPSTPTATPRSTSTPNPLIIQLQGVAGIVDPTNLGWPRQVQGLNGVVEIPAKPERIITASIGHDEMVLAIAPNERLVAVGGITKNETYSNVAAHVQDKPEITRDPETIIAQDPDIVVTSPFFSADGIEALTRVGIPTIQTQLDHDADARIENILLMGYILGEEQRALEFAREVSERYESLIAVTGRTDERPRVLALTSYSDELWVAGANSTEGSVIEAAGGVNVAAEQGVESNQTTSLEGVIAMNPDVIIIAQPIEFGAEDFRQRLLSVEALSELPAIKEERVYVVESKHFTTLSYWNIRGAEDLARILWPEDFPDPPAESFSLAG